MTMLALGVYAGVITLVTLLKPFISIGLLWGYKAPRRREVSFQPFGEYLDGVSTLALVFGYGGNFILFVPLGGLLFTLSDQRRFKPSVLMVGFIGFLASCSIEVTQFVFRLGITDFDDVLFNTLGALVGAALAKVFGSKLQGLWVALSIAIGVVLAALTVFGPNVSGVLSGDW